MKKLHNAYFLIPAIFTIPGSLLILVTLNISNNKILVYILIFFCEIFVWTNVGPISALAITVIPVEIRARSAGMQAVVIHILGDIISPPIIGLISDRTHSLRTGLQITWMALLVSGIYWGAGYYFLPHINMSSEIPKEAADSDSLTYSEIFFGCCGVKPSAPEIKDNDEVNEDHADRVPLLC